MIAIFERKKDIAVVYPVPMSPPQRVQGQEPAVVPAVKTG
jgi:hypothetical protein